MMAFPNLDRAHPKEDRSSSVMPALPGFQQTQWAVVEHLVSVYQSPVNPGESRSAGAEQAVPMTTVPTQGT